MARCGLLLASLSVILLALFRHVTASFPLLCGQDLVNAVSYVCGERGYYAEPTKRSAGIFELETRAKTFLKTREPGGGFHRSKRRVRTGRIVTECCLNRCSIGYLESYCNPLPEGMEHDPSIHVRPAKSAEEDTDEGRPQAGPSQLDTSTGAGTDPDTSGTRGRDQLESVEEVVSNRLIPTSTTGSSSSSRKKPRKDKSERRNASREAKQARREERRRNRERSSGGRSKGSRRKNKGTDRPSRSKRHGLSLWSSVFLDKELAGINSHADQPSYPSSSERAPSLFGGRTFETQQPSDDPRQALQIITHIPEDRAGEKHLHFSNLMTRLRTIVLNHPHDR